MVAALLPLWGFLSDDGHGGDYFDSGTNGDGCVRS